MRKITYYLMLLLCLMLFPHRVYALEDALDVNGLSNNDTVITEEKEEEKEEEKVVEKPNEENNLFEEEEEEKKVEEVPEGEETKKVVEEEVQVGEGTRKVVEEEQEEAPMEELGEPAMVTMVDEIVINNVPDELIAGETFPFGGDTPEGAPYQLLAENWFGYGYDVSNHPEYYAVYQPVESDIIGPDYDYSLSFYIHLDDGYIFEGPDEYGDYWASLVINGMYASCFCEPDSNNPGNYFLWTNYTVLSVDPNAVLQEDLHIINENTDPTDGREPLYGAELEEEHFKIVSEVWSTYEYTYDDEGYVTEIHTYYNFSDDSYREEWQEDTFTVFSKDKLYSYEIIVVPDEGYRLKINVDEYNSKTIPITIDGQQKNADIYVLYNDCEFIGYDIAVLEDIVPTTEEYSIVEHGNMVMDKAELTDLAIRADGPYSLFEAVYVDGNRIDPERYTNENGETIIKLSSDYLQSLSADTHSIAISFSDGKSAFTTLIITDSNNNTSEEVPLDGTGSSSGAVATPATYTTSDNDTTTITTTSEEDNTLEPVDEEKLKEQEATKEDDEEEEEEKKNKTGLWIGLIILLLVGIAIPVTIYRKEE